MGRVPPRLRKGAAGALRPRCSVRCVRCNWWDRMQCTPQLACRKTGHSGYGTAVDPAARPLPRLVRRHVRVQNCLDNCPPQRLPVRRREVREEAALVKHVERHGAVVVLQHLVVVVAAREGRLRRHLEAVGEARVLEVMADRRDEKAEEVLLR